MLFDGRDMVVEVEGYWLVLLIGLWIVVVV